MNYGLWIYGELDRDRLSAALAGLLDLPADAVDVADDGDVDRNWDAPVSCTVTALTGELHWHLDVHVDAAAVPEAPAEPIAAAWIARALGTFVACQALPAPPSAFYLVGPDGSRTRARIYEDDDGVYRIDAVEHPLAGLPGVRVAAIPEVIREYRRPTPARDRLVELVGPWSADDAVQQVIRLIGAWESMVDRFGAGWPPDGWYPEAYYREDLETRDKLTTAIGAVPEPVRDDVLRAVAEVDERFAGLTGGDGGHASAADLPAGWWWRRVPQPLPWQSAPDTGS
ncbi:hypothetical protein [Actinoplanes sp. M2I2]|uniref:hypothetical protein n=1 Tax=Actinoplanes sp. M2I2 TaxID=1734444 RepID=UPI002020CED8|nr:hypothetical protein [Actinoplanes sp. M2I2]